MIVLQSAVNEATFEMLYFYWRGWNVATSANLHYRKSATSQMNKEMNDTVDWFCGACGEARYCPTASELVCYLTIYLTISLQSVELNFGPFCIHVGTSLFNLSLIVIASW